MARILHGVTGSIAAYKAAILVRLLKKADAEVALQELISLPQSRYVNPFEIGQGKAPNLAYQTTLARRCQLVRHGFALPSL